MVNGSRVLFWFNMRVNKVDQPTISVPCPADKDGTTQWWFERMIAEIPNLAAAGVTDILFPNLLIGQAGPAPGMDGYSVYDDYNFGSPNWPTRFGYQELAMRAASVCHAYGINVIFDHVMHQRSGGNNCTYEYASAASAIGGRFAKHPGCFTGYDATGKLLPGRVQRDPVPDVPDDFAFGDELCPVNATPQRYVWDGLIAAADFMFRTFDGDGARLDDMKGTAISFINAFVTSGAMKGKWFFGEYADGNRDNTNWWVSQVKGRCSALDFDFHYNMAEPMCNAAGSGTFSLASMAGRGMIGNNPMHAVPFVESMDSDTDGFATVVNNKLLGYALLLGGEGLPLIYCRDYLGDPNCYNLGREIANLVYVNRMHANGGTVVRWADNTTYVFERTGNPGLIVALNNDVWNPNWKTVTIQTNHTPGTRFHDFSGHNQMDCWVDQEGKLTFGIPPGENGHGYGLWGQYWISGNIQWTPRTTTQVLTGAPDLKTGNLKNGSTLLPQRIYAAAGHDLTATLTLSIPAPMLSTVQLVVGEPSGAILAETGILAGSRAETVASLRVPVKTTGWHTLALVASALPASGIPFEVSVTYMGSAD